MKRVWEVGFREMMWGLGDHDDYKMLRVKM